MPSLMSCYQHKLLEAGCDEAGRGCLAGPVFAAAVILPKGWKHPLLNDSKKLNQNARDELRALIEKEALHWGIGQASVSEIDDINILNASFLAMHRAIDALRVKPEFLIIDGNRFKPYLSVQHTCVVGGDGKYNAIAAASVLAKTYRDDYMAQLHSNYPYYDWQRNKGYPTVKHREAIQEFGPCSHHRKSFTLLPAQLHLFDPS